MTLAQEWKSSHSLQAEEEAPVALLPFPRVVKWGNGVLKVPPPSLWKLSADAACLRIMQSDDGKMITTAYRNFLQALCHRLSSPKDRPIAISLAMESIPGFPDGAEPEGYSLVVGEQGVRIRAPQPGGLFNALQTLRQLVLPDGSRLPYCEITDWPAFSVRGFHHDCGRNFQSIESLKRQIDLASQLKVNYFHWHLADDPAWRVECKAYPQLNESQYRTRDVNDTYTYEQIRELVHYARERHITIIPELDMPGHSEYFNRAFGFSMHSERGIKILEELIDEFCAEIPVELCPIFHFGADEVSVPEAAQFVERISRRIQANGRIPMQWEGPWDLPVGKLSIAQRWVQSQNSQKSETIRSRTIDSSIGYSNLFDPALLVRRWFFMRPCGAASGDTLRLGAIFCTWPDIRVDDKSRIPLHNPMWPGLCAMAERSWNGAAVEGDKLTISLPDPTSEASRAFALFEKRLMMMRRSTFAGEHFPYWPESGQMWDIIGPVPETTAASVRTRVLAGNYQGLQVRHIHGASLYFRTRAATWDLGLFPTAKPGVRVWAVAHLSVPQDGNYPFMLGFDTPARSNRQYTGVPFPGEWSQCATRIWVNGHAFPNARHYELAGRNRISYATWHTEDNERPLCDEEIWWTLPATMIPLRQGPNTLIIEQPYTDSFQSWQISAIRL